MTLPEPRRLERRPVYTVAPDPPHGWRVTARRGRRGRGGFPTRAAAVAHAERLAAACPVAQVRVYGADGRLRRDTGVRNEARCREAQEWLEAYLAPFHDYARTRALLVDEWYAEDRPVEVAGEALCLRVTVHEGQAWDEVHVHGSLFDEPILPVIAETAFAVFGW
ncbi:MAG: hypothetical protein H6R33_613 [Actinobacteria bacterium]|nr:hypothetical protein [Actinomycetota bacterium]